MGWWEWIERAASIATLANFVRSPVRPRPTTTSKRTERGTFRRTSFSLRGGLCVEEGTFEEERAREPNRGLGGELTGRAPEEDARAGRPYVGGDDRLGRKQGAMSAVR